MRARPHARARREPGFEHSLKLPSLLHPRPGSQRGQKNRNQWAAKPGHYLTGTRCHWLAPVPVRAVAMTVWTRVAQRCQNEAPLFSPGIPIQLQGALLGPQEKNRAPAGTRTPLTTPTTSLPQPLPFGAWPHPVTTQVPADSQTHITTQGSAGLCADR